MLGKYKNATWTIKNKDVYKSKLNGLGEEFIYALIDNPYECPIVIGKDGIIKFMSRYSRKLLGINGDEAIGKHITEVVSETHLHEILKDGKARIGDPLYIAGRQQLISRIPLKDLKGNLIGAVGKGMLDEVTRLRDLQRKVELLDGQLEYYQKQINKLKGGNQIIGESPPLWGASCLTYDFDCERTWINCATILTAISSGVSDPILRPIGA